MSLIGGSHLAWIHRAVAARLVARDIGTPSTVVFYQATPTRRIPDAGDPVFCLWGGAQRPKESWEKGGGRINTGVDGTLKVGVWSRQGRDHAYRADRALNDDQGINEVGHRVVACLQEFFPADEDNTLLVARGLRWAGTEEPVEHATARDWLLMVVSFAVQYRLDMTPDA